MVDDKRRMGRLRVDPVAQHGMGLAHPLERLLRVGVALESSLCRLNRRLGLLELHIGLGKE